MGLAGNEEKARGLLFRYLCYLASSAAGLVDEPRLYGPFRLVDAAERLIDIMSELGWSDPFLNELHDFIAREKDGVMTDEEGFVAFLNQVVDRLATELPARSG
ncbi:MAG: DUF6092 family protein [Bacillota bacterium]|nr:DUF6092 family protein [Bacillota bacterium]